MSSLCFEEGGREGVFLCFLRPNGGVSAHTYLQPPPWPPCRAAAELRSHDLVVRPHGGVYTLPYLQRPPWPPCRGAVELHSHGHYNWLVLYTCGILFHVGWCIRQLWSSFVISYNTTTIAYNPHTNIYPLLNIKLKIYTPQYNRISPQRTSKN